MGFSAYCISFYGWESVMIKCPIHNMTDCSPLLNGCSLVIQLNKLEKYRLALVEILEVLPPNDDSYDGTGNPVIGMIAREALYGD
jgi:hypothetical protein